MFQKNSKQPETCTNKLKSITSLDLFSMTKDALIKKMQVLIHQLKVYYQMEQENPNIQKKDYFEKDIIIQSLTNNQQILKKQCKGLQNQLQTIKKIADQREIEIGRHIKEKQLLKKKINDLQIFKSKGLSNEEKNKEFKIQITQMETQNKELRKNVLLLKSRIAIVQQLSKEIQQKAIQSFLQGKQNSSKQTIQHQKSHQTEKQNINPNIQKSKEKLAKIQTLSLKEQIRNLRQQLRLSQQGKQALRLKLQQRELFYSKMISSKY